MDFLVLSALSVVFIIAILVYLFFLRQVKGPLSSEKRLKRNISLFKQRQKDLDNDLANALIKGSDHEKLKTESARNLIKTANALSTPHIPDTPNTPATSSASARKTPFILLLAFLLVPLTAYPIYHHLGAAADIDIQQQLNALKTVTSSADFAQQSKTLQSTVEERLKQQPDNLDYRLLAARFAMTQGDYAKASAHFTVIVELIPNDAEALAYLAQARFLQKDRKLDTDTRSLLDKALTINPNQITALSILGIDAFEQQNYRQAIDYWSPLLAQMPPNDRQTSILQKGIDEAKKKLGEQSTITPQNITPQKSASKRQVSVEVKLADTLNHLDKNATVFVYAKAATGPPMPLAAKKLRVKDLPITVILDDSTAMMPSMKLSNFDKVIVGARISLSGSPAAQKGDWQAISPTVTHREKKTVLLINTQIP